MAYEIIKRLRAKEEKLLLLTLQNNIEAKRKANNKLHDVWKLSSAGSIVSVIHYIKQI